MPISLQDKVDNKLDRLIKERRIINLQESSNEHFVSPIVVTVKKSIKLALESREVNNQVHTNKDQMPNIDELVDGISQIIVERKAGDVYSTTLIFTYAYDQVSFEQNFSEQCSRRIIDGNISN